MYKFSSNKEINLFVKNLLKQGWQVRKGKNMMCLLLQIIAVLPFLVLRVIVERL